MPRTSMIEGYLKNQRLYFIANQLGFRYGVGLLGRKWRCALMLRAGFMRTDRLTYTSNEVVWENVG